MSGLVDLLNDVSPDWLALMFAITWQSSVLVLLVACVARLLRRASPVVRYWLWQLVAIKLLLMPLWTQMVPVPWPAAAANPASVPVQHAAALASATLTKGESNAPQVAVSERAKIAMTRPVAPPQPKLTWTSTLLAAWAAIVIAQIARLAWQRWRLSRLLRRTKPAPAPVIAVAEQASAEIGMRRVPSLLVIDENCSPFACGIVRPRIVLPRTLLAELTTAELRQTLAHELAHVARADLAWIWPGQLARVMYFFNPFVHLLVGQIRLECELACDQWVVARAGHAPAEYMQTLIHVVSHLSQTPQEAAS